MYEYKQSVPLDSCQHRSAAVEMLNECDGWCYTENGPCHKNGDREGYINLYDSFPLHVLRGFWGV